jgi:hypothetical protein
VSSPAQSSDLIRPVDPRCSNHARFAKSFQVPPKGRHALFDPEVEAAADLPIHEGKPSLGGTCRTHGAPIITVNTGPKMKVMQPKDDQAQAQGSTSPLHAKGSWADPAWGRRSGGHLLPAEMEMPSQPTEIMVDQFNHLENRVLHMEDTLGRILNHLESSNRASSQ